METPIKLHLKPKALYRQGTEATGDPFCLEVMLLESGRLKEFDSPRSGWVVDA